jgi:hypothetical protein
VESLSCTQRWECSSVTTNYNYADCIASQCTCLTAFGFSGNATTNNKCSCTSPNQVYWEGSNAFCIQFSDAVQYKLNKAKADRQKAVVQTVYDSLIYPTPAIIMNQLIQGQPSFISTLYSPNAVGRVDPVGKFNDYEGLIEYFYGFVWLPFSIVTNIRMVKLISQDNIVYFNVHISFLSRDPATGVERMRYNLTQSGSFTFDDNGLIISTDLVIHNLGASPGGNVVPAYDPTFAASTCLLIVDPTFGAGCNSSHDPTGYYTNFTDCVNFMLSPSTPWGSWDNVYFGGNSVVCRTLHALLAIGRPFIHCSHSGKTGGGKCINHEYQSYYLENF